MLSCGSVFTGIGLLDYGLHLAGIRHAWVCEADEWRRERILAQRFPGAVRYDDVRTVGRDCEPVDLIAGGFPCKGASTAGKRNGFDHAETVLWREMARAVGELRPRYVLVENVANILALHDGAVWGEVLGDLAALGYDVVWDCLPAAAVGAPHRRDRVFAVATHAEGSGGQGARPGRAALERAAADDPLPASDALLARLEGRGLQGPAPDRAPASSYAHGDGVRDESEPERRGGHTPVAGRPGEAPADADGARQHQLAQRNGTAPGGGLELPAGDEPQRRGVRVEWGAYGPAVRRWEAIAGAAPEPLVRRVDDRGASRVERSRLSALGDGVQCQVGLIAGAYIVEQERRRVTPFDQIEGQDR